MKWKTNIILCFIVIAAGVIYFFYYYKQNKVIHGSALDMQMRRHTENKLAWMGIRLIDISANDLSVWRKILSNEIQLTDHDAVVSNIASIKIDHSGLTDIHKDAWNRPYHIQVMQIRTNISDGGLDVSYRMWSDGPNGRNERGDGDDVATGPISIRLRHQ